MLLWLDSIFLSPFVSPCEMCLLNSGLDFNQIHYFIISASRLLSRTLSLGPVHSRLIPSLFFPCISKILGLLQTGQPLPPPPHTYVSYMTNFQATGLPTQSQAQRSSQRAVGGVWVLTWRKMESITQGRRKAGCLLLPTWAHKHSSWALHLTPPALSHLPVWVCRDRGQGKGMKAAVPEHRPWHLIELGVEHGSTTNYSWDLGHVTFPEP